MAQPMNPVLRRLLDQRAEQETFVDQLLARVEAEDRDLVDAERSNLEAARQRIAELDEQIRPLEEFEAIREAHRANMPAGPTPPAAPAGRGVPLGAAPREMAYRTAGDFLVDVIRAAGYPGANLAPDLAARERVSAAVGRDVTAELRDIQHQTTAETPGLLPEPIIGAILTDLDGARPFVQSVGVLNLAGIPGKVFHRPHVTQHTTTGEQTAEKTELPSRQFRVEGIPFTKRTFGGALNVSRQDIDWTSPAAWDALISDLQMEYGADTDDFAAVLFEAGITQTVPLGAGTGIDPYIDALYAAAVLAATGGGSRRATALRLPNTIWTSVDMWATLGAAIDKVRTSRQADESPGQSAPTSFAGDILAIPRVVAPGLPEGSVIVGRTSMFEFYEERIGLLQAVEPKVLGVEVAYGGYAAAGFLDATAFAKVTAAGEEPAA